MICSTQAAGAMAIGILPYTIINYLYRMSAISDNFGLGRFLRRCPDSRRLDDATQVFQVP